MRPNFRLVKAQKLTPAERKAIGKQLAEARKQIPPEERKRIAKAAVAAREAKRHLGLGRS